MGSSCCFAGTAGALGRKIGDISLVQALNSLSETGTGRAQATPGLVTSVAETSTHSIRFTAH
jgi:hypothetical protein